MTQTDTPYIHTLLDKRLYMVVVNRHLSMDHIQQIDEEMLTYLNASTAPLVHFLYDTRLTLNYPSINELRRMKFPTHTRTGYGVLIGKNHNPAMDVLFTMLSAIFRARVTRVLSVAEACEFLIRKDPTLPPLETWLLPTDTDTNAQN